MKLIQHDHLNDVLMTRAYANYSTTTTTFFNLSKKSTTETLQSSSNQVLLVLGTRCGRSGFFMTVVSSLLPELYLVYGCLFPLELPHHVGHEGLKVQHGDGQLGTDRPPHTERFHPDPLGACHVHAHVVAALQEPLWVNSIGLDLPLLLVPAHHRWIATMKFTVAHVEIHYYRNDLQQRLLFLRGGSYKWFLNKPPLQPFIGTAGVISHPYK
jgi:hypothetical protein